MKYELLDDGNSRWLDLKWTGYNDDAWWTKWSKEQDTVCKDDRVFRIDFETCDVYEVFDGRAL